MSTRAVILAGVTALLLAVAGGGAWWEHAPPGPVVAAAADAPAAPTAAPAPSTAPLGPLPIPPVPPRIAQGPQYEACLNMLSTDPQGAQMLAETWQEAGGGDGAEHCLALARIELGDPEGGATLLEQIGATSHGPAVARASIYGQATQAWLMAGKPDRAYGAATLALALSSEDPELLIDRAVAAGALERWQDAADDLRHALQVDPRRPDAMVLLGSALRHLGDLDAASAEIAKALAMDPQNAEALLERGIIRQRRNDLKGARADWERAMVLAPDTTTADLAQQNLALLEAGPAQQ